LRKHGDSIRASDSKNINLTEANDTRGLSASLVLWTVFVDSSSLYIWSV